MWQSRFFRYLQAILFGHIAIVTIVLGWVITGQDSMADTGMGVMGMGVMGLVDMAGADMVIPSTSPALIVTPQR